MTANNITAVIPNFDKYYFWSESRPVVARPIRRQEEKAPTPLVIDLYIMMQQSKSYDYIIANFSKELSMMRINACYEVAKVISKASSKNLAIHGFNKADAQADCINGMNILPSTLIFLCYVEGRNILHKKGDAYFWESTEGEVTIVDYDKMTMLENADPTCIVNTCVRITNVTKPLKSIHSYKLSELQEIQSKLSKVPSNLTTKKDIYEAIQGILLPF